MNILRGIAALCCTIAGLVLLSSWGGTGHYIINLGAGSSFPNEMVAMSEWVNFLAAHASDADKRKSTDPSESPRHYIDLDNYPGFISNGTIFPNIEQAISTYGVNFVYSNGILPWATKATYDSLIRAMRDGLVEKAKLLASDLGHYVADGHMPLHLTKNYNGQLSGNTGIHSRYESTMINAYSEELYNFESKEVSFISNVQGYINSYIAENYKYVDTILFADTKAYGLSSDYGSMQYREALWEYSENFTKRLFIKASQRTAELIYSAWVEAGRPSLTGAVYQSGTSGCFDIYPNPFSDAFSVNVYSGTHQWSRLQVIDINGCIKKSFDLLPDSYQNGSYRFFDMVLPSGIYLFRLIKGDEICSRMVLVEKIVGR